MNKDTMEAIIKEINKLQDNYLFHPKDYDDKTFHMLTMSFMREVLTHLKDKECMPKYHV